MLLDYTSCEFYNRECLMPAESGRRPSFVIAASVAAELHHAMQVARGVSLTAKNARAIAVRAGEQSIGFKAITNFIDDLARSMISQADRINRIAIGISRAAVMQLRARDALARFARVTQGVVANNGGNEATGPRSSYLASINGSYQRIEAQVVELANRLQSEFQVLDDELGETQRQIRSADIIATTSKVEASRAGAYGMQLEVIADNIRQSADEIKKHLAAAQRLMLEIKEA